MTETFTLPGFDWLPFLLPIIVVSIGMILLAFVVGLPLKGWRDVVAGVTFMALFLMWAFWGGFGGVEAAEDYDEAVRVDKLAELGYDNVQVVVNDFTASDDGEYVAGKFIRVDSAQWTLFILEGASND